VTPLAELPTAQRIRFIRPVFDWAAIREAIDEENGRLGPEWGTF